MSALSRIPCCINVHEDGCVKQFLVSKSSAVISFRCIELSSLYCVLIKYNDLIAANDYCLLRADIKFELSQCYDIKPVCVVYSSVRLSVCCERRQLR